MDFSCSKGVLCMPAHIFVLDEINYRTCINRGLVGLPEANPDSKNHKSINDALLSRLAIMKDGDMSYSISPV